MTARSGNRPSRCEDGQFELIEIRAAEHARQRGCSLRKRQIRRSVAVMLRLALECLAG
jgi:hypothetical protein